MIAAIAELGYEWICSYPDISTGRPTTQMRFSNLPHLKYNDATKKK